MGDMTDAQFILALLGLIAGPGGAAWVAVRVGLNGARQDIRDIKKAVQLADGKLDDHGRELSETRQRVNDHDRRLDRLEVAG